MSAHSRRGLDVTAEPRRPASFDRTHVGDRLRGEPVSNPALRTKAYRNIPAGESHESSSEVVRVLDPHHALYGRSFQLIRKTVV